MFPTSEPLIIQPSFLLHPDPPRDGEIHEHPEVKRHEWRYHNVLIKRLKRSEDPSQEVYRLRHSLGDYDMEVISRAIGDVALDRSGEEDDLEEGDQDGDVDDETGGRFS